MTQPAETVAPSPDQQAAAVKELFKDVRVNRPASWVNELPLATWDGIKIDAAGHVSTIKLNRTHIGGRLNNEVMLRLKTALPSLRYFSLKEHNLSGPCDLNNLPDGLAEFDLSRASATAAAAAGGTHEPKDEDEPNARPSMAGLTGVIDFTKLPSQVRFFNVQRNDFTSDFSANPAQWQRLTQLPLRLLWLSHNRGFVGEIPENFLRFLPSTLTALSLSNCGFESRGLNVSVLPATVTTLNLHGNSKLRLRGDITAFAPQLDNNTIRGFRQNNLQIAAYVPGAEPGTEIVTAQLRGDAFYQLAQEWRSGGAEKREQLVAVALAWKPMVAGSGLTSEDTESTSRSAAAAASNAGSDVAGSDDDAPDQEVEPSSPVVAATASAAARLQLEYEHARGAVIIASQERRLLAGILLDSLLSAKRKWVGIKLGELSRDSATSAPTPM